MNACYEIADKLIKLLKNDTDIKLFFQTLYQKDGSFYLGIDEDNPPSASTLPAVAVRPISSGISTEYNSRQHVLYVGCSIYCRSVTNTDGVQRFEGYSEIDNLMRLVQDKVQNCFLSSLSQGQYEILNINDVQFSQLFPYYHGQFEITIVTEV